MFGLAGPVEPGHLRRLLEGRDARSGADLPLHRRSDRRAGWGLVFSAPKSVSLLATTNADVADAHIAAVEGVVGYLESRLRLRRVDDQGQTLKADALLAASFDHTTNAASEPHLHTHVVVANASRSGDVWGAVTCDDWSVDRDALAALFELELRHQMGERGIALDWRLRSDGLADVADVPRAAVRATSSQGRRARLTSRFDARATATPQPWEARAEGAGFTGAAAAVGAAAPARAPGAAAATFGRQPAGGRPQIDDPQIERAVGLRLASRRSDFRRADVIETLASCWPGGASVGEATAWADRFCDRSIRVPSPTSQPRWATPSAQRLDQELLRQLDDRSVRFLGSRAGCTNLLAQAEFISEAARSWDGSGRRAAVDTPDPMAEARWGVLTGLAPWKGGHGTDVLVVDRADRRPTADLLRLVRAHEGELVFVEGGTLPRLTSPASRGLTEAGDRIGRLTCDGLEPWGQSLGPERDSDRLVGRQAADALLFGWRTAGDGSVLVALGLEEIRALNQAVVGASRAAARGAARFEPGDCVVALKSGAGAPPFGTLGTVTRRAGDAVEFEWRGGPGGPGGPGEPGERRVEVTADDRRLAGVDFGYAVSPRVAAGLDCPLRVFGPAEALARGRGLERVVASIEVAEDALRRDRGLEVGW